MSHERTQKFRDVPEHTNLIEVCDLGRGLSLCMDMDTQDHDPDPALVAADLFRRLGVEIAPARLASLMPAELEEAFRFAASELLHRAIADGRLARRLPPVWLLQSGRWT